MQEAKVAKLKRELHELAQQIIEIENEISSARLRGGQIPSLMPASPSRRSVGVLKAWASLHQAITTYEERDGLPMDLAHRAHALPGTPGSTIRSYLHRLKRRGFIAEANGRWTLCKQIDSSGVTERGSWTDDKSRHS